MKVPINNKWNTNEFYFDTGASSYLFLQLRPLFLYKHGTITDEDILGSIFFSKMLHGTVSEGTQIGIKSVKIGD